MRLLYFLMGAVFIIIYSLLNFYLGLRMWQYLWSFIPLLSKQFYWITFSILALSYILSIVGHRFIPIRMFNFINLVGAYWLGVIFYLTITLVSLDIIRLIVRWLNIIPRGWRDNSLAYLPIGVTIFLVTISILIYGTWNARNLEVIHHNVSIEKKSKNLSEINAVLVSDIHLGSIMDNKRLIKLVEVINDLSPDIVFLAGDVIDEKVGPFIEQEMSDSFKNIKTKYGIYTVLGNHEYIGREVEDIILQLQDAGINVLIDEYVEIADSFYIVGRDDTSKEYYYKEKRKSLSDVTNELDKELPIILLDHQPKDLEEAYLNGIDLQLSGHTHRGQLYPNHLITKKIFELDWGYLKKESLNVIVSSGYGTWGPPIRLGSRAEVISINIKFNR